jgi:hypothetical protein
MKALIFDSGALINLAMNNFLYILKDLKKLMKGKFLITEDVKYEIIDRPSGIKKYELESIRIQALLDEGTLELPKALGIENEEIKREREVLMNLANHSVEAENNFIEIVSKAEMSCLSLSSELSKRGIENIIAIDERTTRILSEKPENMEKIMESKFHYPVKVHLEALKAFSNFRFVRSSELVYVAFKKGLIGLKGENVLEAALYATKFKGSSISFEEIEILKKI